LYGNERTLSARAGWNFSDGIFPSHNGANFAAFSV
jgi:hypothetical protein